MLVTYKPEDGSGGSWEFDPAKVRTIEAALVEKVYGQPWEKFCGDAQAGSMKARRVLLWHLQRREHHALRFDDVPDFYTGELTIEHNLVELRALREQLDAAAAGLTAAELEQARAMLDGQIAGMEAAGGLGKAISSSDETPG